MNTKVLSDKLYNYMMSSDRAKAKMRVENGLSNGIKPHAIIHEILDPALEPLSTMWQNMQASLSQPFFAEDDLLICQPKSGRIQKHKGTVVIGNIEADFHSLGRRVVVSFLNTANWEVIDLGNDVPPKEFIKKTLETGSDELLNRLQEAEQPCFRKMSGEQPNG